MLSSTVEQVKLTVSDQFKKFGYSALALALRQLIHNGQRKLAAMIIVALCLAPRKTGVENSGVCRILGSISLWRLAKVDTKFMYELRLQAEQSINPNKVQVTLVVMGWLDGHYWPNNRNPWFQANDGCIYFNYQTHLRPNGDFQHLLCDHAGCQREKYFPHFRMIWDGPQYCQVRVIGQQFDRDHKTLANAKALPNGYYEYLVPSETVLYGFGEKDGRTLADLLEPGVWYNYYFQPDTPLDLVDHEAEQKLTTARQSIANLAMKFGALNG